MIEPMPIILPRMNWAHCTIAFEGLLCWKLEQQAEKNIKPCRFAPQYCSASRHFSCVRGVVHCPSRHFHMHRLFPPYLLVSFPAIISLLSSLAFGFWLASFGKIAPARSFSWNQYCSTHWARETSNGPSPFACHLHLFFLFARAPSTQQNPAISYHIHHEHEPSIQARA